MPDDLARQLLEDTFYGEIDIDRQAEVESFETFNLPPSFSPTAKLVQWRLNIRYSGGSRPLDLVLLLPDNSQNSPIIISQNFCPNHNVIPFEGVRPPNNVGFDCSGRGVMGILMTSMFGRYIVNPPVEDILRRGYGFAAIYPSQVVPDQANAGQQILDTLFPDTPNRSGALAVWADLFSVAGQTIEDQFGGRTLIAYGHSRFGKTALLSGAWSDDIDIVVAHQSGTLGASALDDKEGEPLDALVKDYPHWPGPALEALATRPNSLPVRPSNLLSLLAEKPVLLGNARRDVWSDPWGAFTESKSAWESDFGADDPSDFRPDDTKAYWLRPGTHGVVKEDWPAFLDFLDAHTTR